MAQMIGSKPVGVYNVEDEFPEFTEMMKIDYFADLDWDKFNGCESG